MALRAERPRAVGERVRSTRVDRLERVLLRVDDLEVLGGLAASRPRSCSRPASRRRTTPRRPSAAASRRQPAQVVAVLEVVRVDDARDLDLVLEVADVDVEALGLAEGAHLVLVAAARQREGGAEDEDHEQAGGSSRRRSLDPRDGGARARGPRPPRGSAAAAAAPLLDLRLNQPREAERLDEAVGRQRRLGLEHELDPGAAAGGGLERPARERLDAVVLAAAADRRRSGAAPRPRRRSGRSRRSAAAARPSCSGRRRRGRRSPPA